MEGVKLEKGRKGDILGDNTSGAHTLGTFCHQKFALLLDRLIDIVAFACTIWFIVMSNIVDAVLGEKFCRDDPGTIRNNFVNPLAMSDSFCTLSTSEDGQAFALVGLCITRHTNKEIGLWKGVLCLLELPHVTSCS